MINLKLLRDPAYVKALEEAVRVKRMSLDVEALVAADDLRRSAAADVAELRSRRKSLDERFRRSSTDEKARLRAEGEELSDRIAAAEEQLRTAEARTNDLALAAPAIPDPEVPFGLTDADNLAVSHWGDRRLMDDTMSDHVELARNLGLVEFERVQRFAGSRSYALVGNGALLGRAILQFALDLVIRRGYDPTIAPVLVREAAMTGTGYFPLGVDDAYKTDREDRYLVGTSEVSLVSLYRDEVIDLADLPIRAAGISSCFRREAGSHGRDTRGLYRVNQFEKVEQIVLTPADETISRAAHAHLLENAELILQAMELPYRVALACTGDIGQGQVLKHEIETWMPSRGAYCETHSCSSFRDFQTRRSNIRYRTADGSVAFAFSLNNTAIAIPRVLIPLLEHHQRPDGCVRIPRQLRPYLNGLEVLEPSTRPADLIGPAHA